ncbi:DUF1501 domain-containing protein [Roseomonas sp. AR75]|uniref:DUF1501 domain-containing protein n=1 Tax=Roseomonas sp. AR75 TaxID=2562311 RepID=UPI0010C09E6B|nr:DUF1501 domain-containing protein [Roseomonas sp. AR75]
MSNAPRAHASFSLGRRGLLLGLGTAMVLGGTRAAFARLPGERRFVVILQRGAMDGLYAVQPYADPELREIRASLALPEPGQEGGLLDLGGRFGLHPAFATLHAMYAANEALLVHAVAGPYRSRSHFDAQDMLEAGADQRLSSGWLNRALGALPNPAQARTGLAVGTNVPLLMQGPTPVGAWFPPGVEQPSPDLYARLAALQAGDPALGTLFAEGLRARGFATSTLGQPTREPGRGRFPQLAAAAGKLLAEAGGPRVAVLELGGWDTHVAQANAILGPVRALDEGLGALKTALGPQWSRTVVLVITEFGRTARANGNAGTDHGTAGVAILAGGAVAGGQVKTDWPGLTADGLLDNRDLRPTADLRSVAKALLAGHLDLPGRAVAQAFPNSESVRPMAGLLRG